MRDPGTWPLNALDLKAPVFPWSGPCAEVVRVRYRAAWSGSSSRRCSRSHLRTRGSSVALRQLSVLKTNRSLSRYKACQECRASRRSLRLHQLGSTKRRQRFERPRVMTVLNLCYCLTQSQRLWRRSYLLRYLLLWWQRNSSGTVW